MLAAIFAASLNPADWPPERVAQLLGAIIPLIVAAATKVGAGSQVRAAIAGILGLIAGPVAGWISGAGAPLVSWATGHNVWAAWLATLLTYLAGWQPILDINRRVLPDKGIGPKTTGGQ